MLSNMFRLARSAGGFAYYGAAHRLPALYYLDFGFVAILVATITVAILTILLLPALKGRRATLTLGGLMLGTALAQGYAHFIPEWQVGGVHLHDVALSYWPGTPRTRCSIWLGVGLVGANVTLVCEGREHPYYNEHLDLNEQAEALHTSLLAPLQVAAAPITGTSGLYLRRAGHWTQSILYLAAALWAWAVVMIAALPSRAGAALVYLGSSLVAASAVYHALQKPSALEYSLPHGMSLRYGAAFWGCVFSGVITCGSALVLEVLSRRGLLCVTACQMDSFEEVAGSHPVSSPPCSTDCGNSEADESLIIQAIQHTCN